MKPPPRSGSIPVNNQLTPAVHHPHQRLKRQAESEIILTEGEREDHSHTRLKSHHPAPQHYSVVEHLSFLEASHSGVYGPPQLSLQQDSEIRDKPQHTGHPTEQPQQTSYTFNEGISQTPPVERKKLRPQKKNRNVERLQQMRTKSLEPTPGENYHWELLYPNLANQFNMAMNETYQIQVQGEEDPRSNSKTGNSKGTEETKQLGKQATALAFKAPRAQ